MPLFFRGGVGVVLQHSHLRVSVRCLRIATTPGPSSEPEASEAQQEGSRGSFVVVS